MTPNQRFTISIDPSEEPMLSIEFLKKDARLIKQAIRSRFKGKIPVERLPDSRYRVSFDSRQHDESVIWLFYNSLPHALGL